jgi:lipopolysaccharide transport system ATP-binding protein
MGSIHVEGLGKFYKRYTNRWSRLIEWLDPDEIVRHEKHWVLRDVGFDIRAGESVGIIGHNGAGKSTLLKIITGTTQPGTGKAEIRGRVAALLELGMGFHPDFSGRQNAYMSGQLLGYSNEEVTERMEAIETFAEIGDYIDQPVRTYSSGMQVRLAFSVATCIRPDILIVDEALSVGDIYFQQKCFERIESFAKAGTTLLFVSHSMSTVLNLCDRAILLKGGRVEFDGDPKAAVDLYQADLLLRMDKHPEQLRLEPARAEVSVTTAPSDLPDAVEPVAAVAGDPGSITTAAVDFLGARLLRGDGDATTVLIADDEAVLELTYLLHESMRDPAVGFKIRNPHGIVLYETNSYCLNLKIGKLAIGVPLKFRFGFRARLAPGEYTVTVGFADGGYDYGSFERALNYQHGVMAFSIAENIHGVRWAGLVNLDVTFESPNSALVG